MLKIQTQSELNCAGLVGLRRHKAKQRLPTWLPGAHACNNLIRSPLNPEKLNLYLQVFDK